MIRNNGEKSAIEFNFAWLERAEFDPSEGITLYFGGKLVRIIGRNLDSEPQPNIRLFAGILRHRVVWVQEPNHSTLMLSPETALVVEEMKFV